MWSHPLAIEEIMVVSEMGETWSPKIPPDITAPIIKGIGRLNDALNAKAMGIIIENVPQLVPVEKEVMDAMIKTKKGKRKGGMFPCIISDRYVAVPNSLITFPIRKARSKIRTMGIMSEIPSYRALKYFLCVRWLPKI